MKQKGVKQTGVKQGLCTYTWDDKEVCNLMMSHWYALPDETHNDGKNAEGHEDTVGHISQVDSKSPELRVMY